MWGGVIIESSAPGLPKLAGAMTIERLLRTPLVLDDWGGVSNLVAAAATDETRLVEADLVLKAGDPTFILAVSCVMW